MKAPGRLAAIVLALVEAVTVCALVAAPVAPAAAQFFDDRRPQRRQQPSFNPFGSFFGGGGGGGGGRGGFYSRPNPYPSPYYDDRRLPQQQQQQQQPAVDYSHAPAARKPDTPPASTILVLGDSMADWLAYGLEDAYSDTPETGVVRKIKTYSGLIHYEAKGDTDWTQVAREAIAAEKPNFIVMMLGVNDRQTIRDKAPSKDAKKAEKKADKKGEKKDEKAEKTDKIDQKSAEEDADQPDLAAEEPASRGRSGSAYEFRSEKWEQLYEKHIDDMIAVLKSHGVPVIWVGLPAVRGTKSTSDMQYLDGIFRASAEKAGIIYVDDWDGFVDENGRFTVRGPDFEGQIRPLRTADGVHFTKSGARKLAHYVERELQRVMSRPPTLVSLPTQPQTDEQGLTARPGVPLSRPLAGPVVPLSASPEGADELAGGAAPRQRDNDALASRVLVKGEQIVAPAGRADDSAWPRREIASTKAAPPTAISASPSGKAATAIPAKKNEAAKPAAPKSRTSEAGGPPREGARPKQRQRSDDREAGPRAPSGFGGGLFGIFQ